MLPAAAAVELCLPTAMSCYNTVENSDLAAHLNAISAYSTNIEMFSSLVKPP